MSTRVEPATSEEVSEILARASPEGQRVEVRGAGTKMSLVGDVRLKSDATSTSVSTAPSIVLSTKRLHAIVAHRHGDLTATVQAGAALADVNRALAAHGQWLPLDPPFADRATIGGIVSTNDSGPRRHRYGAPRDLIIGAEFVRADGVAAKAGGIVVKNVAGYDVARLLTGSFGTLAVIVSATFKLYPLPEASRTVVIECSTDRIGAIASTLLASQLTPTAIELQTPPGRLLVRFETIESAADQQAAAVATLAANGGGVASIVRGDEEAALWAAHARRPWDGEGAVFKLTLLPSDLAQTLAVFDASGLEHDVVGRAGVGVLLARVGGDAAAQARVLADLRAQLAPPRGSVTVIRAPAELARTVDVWGPLGDALPLMRALKQRFDPAGILNRGHGPLG